MSSTAAVADFLLAYTGKLSTKSIPEAMDDWEDAEDLFYIAEEIEQPIIGKTNIARYWQNNCQIIYKLNVRVGEMFTRKVAESLTSALFPMHWNGMMGAAGGACLGGDVKVTALVKEFEGRLLICQWTESSLGPLPFIRKIYAANVDPDFKT